MWRCINVEWTSHSGVRVNVEVSVCLSARHGTALPSIKHRCVDHNVIARLRTRQSGTAEADVRKSTRICACARAGNSVHSCVEHLSRIADVTVTSGQSVSSRRGRWMNYSTSAGVYLVTQRQPRHRGKWRQQICNSWSQNENPHQNQICRKWSSSTNDWHSTTAMHKVRERASLTLVSRWEMHSSKHS